MSSSAIQFRLRSMDGEVKPDGAPFPEIVVDPGHLRAKIHRMAEELSVVLEPVHADLETGFGERSNDMGGSGVIFGDEIEGGPEPQPSFELHELGAALEAFQRVDIVLQDKRELLLLGPAGPTPGRFRRGRVDRPDPRRGLPFSGREGPPQ